MFKIALGSLPDSARAEILSLRDLAPKPGKNLQGQNCVFLFLLWRRRRDEQFWNAKVTVPQTTPPPQNMRGEASSLHTGT